MLRRIALAAALGLYAASAHAQYIDGLPAATSVSPSDFVPVTQGSQSLTGGTLIPGSGVTRRATVSQLPLLPLAGGTMAGALHMGANLLDGSNVNFSGGALNGVALGSTTPAAGAFTSLGATGAATLSGGGTLSGTFSGGTFSGPTLSGIVAGTPLFSGDLSLTGAGTGLSVTNNATVGGALGVTGAATVGSLMGSISGANVTATGAPTALTTAQFAAQQGVLLDAFHVAGDADDTASLTRAVAAGVPILLGPRTYTINNFSTGNVANFTLIGVPGKSIIQRTSASGSQFFDIAAATVFIDGVTFDMNSANVTANQWGVYLDRGGQKVTVTHCIFENNSGTVGDGFSLLSTGPAAGGSFNFSDNEVSGNTNAGARFGSVSHGVVSRNYVHDNGAVGISVTAYQTASSTNYATDVIVSDNRVARQVLGIIVGGWPSPFVFGSPPVVSVKVTGNELLDNATYGISGGGDYLDVSGNQVSQSAPGVSVFGGIDLLARYSKVSDNVVALSGSSWGIDVGGSVQMTVQGNHIAATSGIALNAGGNQNSLVSNNHLILSATAAGINVANVESSGAAGGTFPTLSSGSAYNGNTIDLGGPSDLGIVVQDNAGAGTGASANLIIGNHFIPCPTCSASQAITWNGPQAAVRISGNDWGGTNVKYLDPNGSGDDVFDLVYFGGTLAGVSSTTTIRSIVPRNVENYSSGQSILYVNPTSPGSGYTSATTLTANGSTGGSGWVGVPMIWQGQIIGVETTAVGSGYTGTVTVTASDSGGGSGAVLVAGLNPRLPITGEIKYQGATTTVLQKSGGAIGLNVGGPLQISNQVAVALQAGANGSGLSWDVASYTLPTFAVGSLPACNGTSNGARVNVTGSTTGKWQAQCNGASWLWPDGTAVSG